MKNLARHIKILAFIGIILVLSMPSLINANISEFSFGISAPLDYTTTNTSSHISFSFGISAPLDYTAGGYTRYDPDANDGDCQPNNDGEYYFAYGDSITRAVQGELSDDGLQCYIHQMTETYDPSHTADNNMDGAGMTSTWGKNYLGSHYNSSNTYFVFLFGQNDLSDADGTNVTKEQYTSNMLYIYNQTNFLSVPSSCAC